MGKKTMQTAATKAGKKNTHGGTRPGAGAPTNYRPEMCERAVEIMRNGGSKTEVMAELKIKARATFREWRMKHPEFDEAIRYGEILSEAWWNKLGRAAAAGKVEAFNSTAFVWMTKNMFGWRNGAEQLETPPHKPEDMTDEQRAQRIAALLNAGRDRRDGRTPGTAGNVH